MSSSAYTPTTEVSEIPRPAKFAVLHFELVLSVVGHRAATMGFGSESSRRDERRQTDTLNND